MAHKAKNIHYLAFYSKSLLTHVLGRLRVWGVVIRHRRIYEEIGPYLKQFDISDDIFSDLLHYQRSVLRVPNDFERRVDLNYDVHGFLSDVYINNIHPLLPKQHALLMRDTDVQHDWPSFGKYVIWYGRMGWASYKDDVREL